MHTDAKNRLATTSEAVIQRLRLEPLECEGGSFARTYEHVRRDREGRKLASAIYYMLVGSERSNWHRVRGGDELWLAHGPHHALQMIVSPDGSHWEIRRLSALPEADSAPQSLIPADYWQSTRLLAAAEEDWALFSAVVVPEFRCADFEAQSPEGLLRLNPGLSEAFRQFETMTVP